MGKNRADRRQVLQDARRLAHQKQVLSASTDREPQAAAIIAGSYAEPTAKPPVTKPLPPGIHLDRKEVVLLCVALTPSLAGLIVEDATSLGVFLVIGWAAFLFLCFIHDGSKLYRGLVLLLITLVYGGIGYRKHYVEVEAKQQDVYDHLSVEMLPPTFRDESPIILYSLKNGASSAILRHRTSCIFNKIMDTENSGFKIPSGTRMTTWVNDPIGPGGDGQTEQCYAQFMKFNGPVVCADVTVKIEYSSSVQPDVVKAKPLRYMASRVTGERWIQQSPEMQGNFCDGLKRR